MCTFNFSKDASVTAGRQGRLFPLNHPPGPSFCAWRARALLGFSEGS